MKTNSEIRQEARQLASGNWGAAVAVTAVLYVILFTTSLIPELIGALTLPWLGKLINLAITILISYPITFSLVLMFLRFARKEQELHVGGLFTAFNSQYYGKSISVYILTAIYTFLWSLLFIIPGIIKALSYSLAPYIAIDNPELSAEEAIEKSMEMMDGYKTKLFLIELGYMGLFLLSLLALGIPILWLQPYYQIVLAKFYEEVKAEYDSLFGK